MSSSPLLIAFLLVISASTCLCRYVTGVRLRGGATPGEGKVEVLRVRGLQWGGVCDDGWGMVQAEIVCKELGFVGAKEALTGSYHGAARGPIWIKSVRCSGDEQMLEECFYFGISRRLRMYEQVDEINECATTSQAGVVCIEETVGNDTIQLGKPMVKANNSLLVKMKVEDKWLPICAGKWTSTESIVACKQAGLKFANLTVGAKVEQLHPDEVPEDSVAVKRIECDGTEQTLQDCNITAGIGETPCRGAYASITCSPFAPDISVNMTALSRDLNIGRKSENKMVCAKSEGCLSESGSLKSRAQLKKSRFQRRLMYFSSNVQNFGNADFRPPQVEGGFKWHACHKHFHSITDFATYELLSYPDGEVVEQGHKVSFCLRDNFCVDNLNKKYQCSENITDGNQGISIGCADHYKYDLDCQWIDITDVPSGTYHLVIKSNPYKLVPEQDYSNNVVKCGVQINQFSFRKWNCHHPADFERVLQ